MSAPGEGGIGVRFDFGHNAIADFYGYRGSFIHYVGGENQPVTGLWNGYPLNLDGPLVRSYDLSGSLSGSDAAIYIGENALVSAINILRGASITGDIISDWDPDLAIETGEGKTLSVVNKAAAAEAGVPLYTDLNFGYRTAADGSADTSSADPDFSLTYSGSISGPETIRLNVIGGNLTLTRESDVYSIRNDASLTLGPQASISATTAFTNSENATLVTPIMSDGTAWRNRHGGRREQPSGDVAPLAARNLLPHRHRDHRAALGGHPEWRQSRVGGYDCGLDPFPHADTPGLREPSDPPQSRWSGRATPIANTGRHPRPEARVPGCSG